MAIKILGTDVIDSLKRPTNITDTTAGTTQRALQSGGGWNTQFDTAHIVSVTTDINAAFGVTVNLNAENSLLRIQFSFTFG